MLELLSEVRILCHRYKDTERLTCLLFFNSNTTQTASGEGGLETEERAASKMLSEAEEIQDSLNDSGITETKVSEMTTREEDVGLLGNDTFVKTGDTDAQTTGKVPFPPNVKVTVFFIFIEQCEIFLKIELVKHMLLSFSP